MPCVLKSENSGYVQWINIRDALKTDKRVISYYTFENIKENRNTLQDLGKSGRNLTYIPYKEPQTGKVYDDLQVVEGRWSEKPAARFTRAGYEGPSLNIENKQFTVEAWFRRQGFGSTVILSSGGFSEGWRIGLTFDEKYSDEVYFCIGRPKVYCARVVAKSPMPENTWHHFAATWDGHEMRVYINGLLVDKEVEMTILEDGNRKRIKKDVYEGEYFETKSPFRISMRVGTEALDKSRVLIDLDEVVIYNKALDAQEILEHSRGPMRVSEKDVFSKADSCLKARNYKGARAEYEKLKGLTNYGREIALFNIAESYRMEKDYRNAHKTYYEILALPSLTPYYHIYGLFQQAKVYSEQKNYNKARDLYNEILIIEGALEHHIFTAQLKIGDTYKAERKYSVARAVYEKLLKQEETSNYPHEGHRRDLIDRLEEIEGLADGGVIKSRQEKIIEWVNRPKRAIYVSPDGKDANAGTKDKPFATIQRTQQEVRQLKAKGMPAGGIVVYLRGGRYFLQEGLLFGKDDSGTETAPVVYRSYPGENVRIIGGKQITNFRPLTDETILKRLPEEARGKVWVADLKQAGITNYGQFTNRGGYGKDFPSPLEVFFNGKVMQIARWPNEGHARTGAISSPDGEAKGRGKYMFGRFHYSGDRPERWLEEKDIWMHGHWYFVYAEDHVKLQSIDVNKKMITVMNDTRWHPTYPLYKVMIGANVPYYAYNLLCELDVPGEWYLDRDEGNLYFYPPNTIETGEVIVSMLDVPLISVEGASNIALFGLTLEDVRGNGVEIKGGYNNLVASSVIRNTGQAGVKVEGGWDHSIVGCDIYDNGAGGIFLTGGDRYKVLPSRHTAENNHIYRFNRFSGGSYANAVKMDGVGQRASHNLIHDAPSIAITFNANDHIIEFNELHDAPYKGREIGAMYIYGEPWYLMSRGTVIRNNFFHHISYHSSPNLNQGLNAIHIDAINGGLVIEKNFFYRFPNGISNPQPENRIENNIFVDPEIRSVYQGDRSELFNTPDGEPKVDIISRLAARYLTIVRYKQPPWNYRYPQLVDLLFREKPIGWAMNNVIERNINTGGLFLSIAPGIKQDNIIRNNWDGDDPLFLDKDNRNFSIRPGSPVYGLIGCEPLTMDSIGVYNDPLRASWPVNRSKQDIGKYYKLDWKPLAQEIGTIMPPLKRISPPAYYTIAQRKNPITIDGRLEKEEWGELDMNNAMVIDKESSGKDNIKGPKSYAWLMYDADNLYVGMKHEPDPYKEGMLPKMKQHIPVFEVAIESQHSAQSRSWWIDDMVTGPIYSITGKFDGELVVNNLFGMPYGLVTKLQKAIEYKRFIQDEQKREWTSEMKIPFSDIGINPSDVTQLAFNIGVYNKSAWFAWVPTGSCIWRLENAGFIRFAR